MTVTLREVTQEDLPIFFEHQLDAEAGTLLGAFFGLQIGQAGAEHERRNRQMAEQSRQRAEEVARMALAHLPPDTAKEVLSASQERP